MLRLLHGSLPSCFLAFLLWKGNQNFDATRLPWDGHKTIDATLLWDGLLMGSLSVSLLCIGGMGRDWLDEYHDSESRVCLRCSVMGASDVHGFGRAARGIAIDTAPTIYHKLTPHFISFSAGGGGCHTSVAEDYESRHCCPPHSKRFANLDFSMVSKRLKRSQIRHIIDPHCQVKEPLLSLRRSGLDLRRYRRGYATDRVPEVTCPVRPAALEKALGSSVLPP